MVAWAFWKIFDLCILQQLGMELSFDLAKLNFHIKLALIKSHTKYKRPVLSSFTQDFESFSPYECM